LSFDANNLLIILRTRSTITSTTRPIGDNSTSFHQAFQGMVILVILSIGKESLNMDGFADDILDLVAPTRSFDIFRKGPLTDTPMLDAAFALSGVSIVSISMVTRHVPTTAPIGLTRHLTKVAAAAGNIRTVQSYTNMMGTMVVLSTCTIPSSGVPRQGHSLQRTRLQGSSIDIQMRRQRVVC
jgi:hypothetical protein